MDEPLVVCFQCNYFEWNVTLVNVPNLSCVNVFSVLIDIVPQMLSIELNLYWTRYIPLSKRTLQLTIFINAVNVHFLAIQSSVPGNSCLNGAMINECPETVTTKLHSLLHHRVKPFNYYSITVQVNLQFWECGKAEQCDEVTRVQLARLRCGWVSARVAFTFLPFCWP